jgi:alpha-L-rhamnosidase
MTSFNHYALGAVADWLHRTVGGLAPAGPGYRQIAVQPRPGGGMTWASARHITPYGMAECSWTIQDGKLEVNVTVPPNTTALVSLPGGQENPIEVNSGTHSWSYAYEDPHARGPLSLDSTIGEIHADPAAWAAVKGVIDRLVPQNGFIMYVLPSQRRRSLRDALATLPNADELLTSISEAFARLEREP